MPQAALEKKHVPVRTCLGCRRKKERQEMWRFALGKHGLVMEDFHGKHDGRHVYCCQEQSCLKRFVKNLKGLSRGFRRQVLGFNEGVQDLFGSEQ